MSSNGYNNPELSAVLKTLSSFAPPRPIPPPAPAPSTVAKSRFPHLQAQEGDDDDEEYEPSDVVVRPVTTPAHAVSPPPANPIPNANRTSGGNSSDPSTITTWPAALKHVMRAVSQNEALQARLRRLIRSQHEHERQWWKGREALIAKQKARVEKKRQLDEVLRSVGVPVIQNPATSSSSNSSSSSSSIQTQEEDQQKENETELKYYDAKVYKASVDMSKAMEAELRNLGIPFFAMKPNLIVFGPEGSSMRRENEKDNNNNHRNDNNNKNMTVTGGTAAERQRDEEDITATRTTISRTDLLMLQRRMLELLQDLCKD